MVTDLRNPRKALRSIYLYMQKEYDLTGNKTQNKTKLESKGFEFDEDIVRYTLSGNIVKLSELSEKDKFNAILIREPINTHIHGRDYHNRISRIGLEIGLEYSYMNTIIGKLFSEKFDFKDKLLNLTTRQLYSFVINNLDNLRHVVRNAMAKDLEQLGFDIHTVSKKDFYIPNSTMFTYDENSKIQTESQKNVYQGYLMSAEPRSSSEKKFEKYCENAESVDWVYKNGDKGEEYLSIVYLDNSNKQKLFYPDYVVSVKGKIWIIETKGGFSKAGVSEDIDIFSSKKIYRIKALFKKSTVLRAALLDSTSKVKSFVSVEIITVMI